MSSHHIIREDQEPALLIDSTLPENDESTRQLLEWSPTVLVTEPALEHILLWGIKIDVVIALATTVETLESSWIDQSPLTILSCSAMHDAVPTALRFLSNSQQKAVNIISEKPLSFFEPFTALDITVMQQGKRWVFIRNGVFEKWLPAGTVISVYPGEAHPKTNLEHDGMFILTREHGFWVCEH